MKYALLTATALTTLWFTPAMANEETEALKKEVKALEARIAQLEAKEKTQAAAASAAAPAAGSSLEKRVAIVERNQELAQEDAKAAAETTPKVEIGSKGFTITSPDKQYSVNMHGYVQADNRTFLDGGAKNGTADTFLIRSARPIIDAKMTDYFNARFMMDFGRGQTTLLDAYGDFHPFPGDNTVNLRMGETKVPVGLERWQSEQDVLFVERGQTTNLVPYRDIGVIAYGQPIRDQLEYQVGIMNGAADLQANTGDADNDKDVVGRVFVHPLVWSGIPSLAGLGFGIGGTYGQHQGSTTAGNLTAGYVTTGQRTYFSYLSGAFADGTQWRVNPQAMYYNGPFSLLGEYVVNDQQIAKGAAVDHIRNDAWEGIATYVLTGEDASFDGVKPAHNFNPKAGGWGAFELVGRVSKLNVDGKAFADGFASPTASSRSALETTFGATWYLNTSVKLNLDYAFTSFDGGSATSANHAPERVILTRTQFKF